MKKLFVKFTLLFIVIFFLSFNSVFAKTPKFPEDFKVPEIPSVPKTDFDILDIDGIYNVPGNPKLKVRVFVHKAKPPKSAELPLLACNLPDPDSATIVPSTGWHLPSNWTYQLNPSSVPLSVGSGNLATMSTDAFGKWSNAAVNKVTFIKGVNTTVTRKGFDGSNIIAWGKASSGALAVSYIWYYPSTGLVAEVDTIMNKMYSWNWSNPANWTNPSTTCANQNSYDAQDILTHELGHWMGLDDRYTSDFVNNTMYGYGSKGEIKKDTLTTGDSAGISAIYP